MNRTHVERHLGNFFPDLHLTIISIIAGVEMAVSATALYGLFDRNIIEFAWSFFLWLPALLYVFLAWYAYMIGALCLEWIPSFGDCLYALLMGLFGCVLFMSIQKPVVWLGFWLASCFTAYLETRHVHTKIGVLRDKGRFEPPEIGDRYLRKMKEDQIGLIVAMSVTACALVLGILRANRWVSSGFGLISSIVFIYLIWKEDNHWKGLQSLLGMRETR